MNRIWTSTGFSILVAAVMMAGCNNDFEDVPSSTEAAQGARFDTLVIPDGTIVLASLDTPLSTNLNHSGDPFTATMTESIDVEGRTLMPSGSQVHGVLQNVENSGRIEGRAQMTLLYQSFVDPQGNRYAISAIPLTLQAASSARGDIEKIAAGTVLGAVIGGIADGGKGAAIGAGAGAGVGTIVVLATKGEDVELSSGQRLAMQTTGATSVQVASR